MDDKQTLRLAIKRAEESVKQGGFPAGAILVKDTHIVSWGVSLGFLLHDPTSHAETASIRMACKTLKTSNLEGATLYASLQPCLMCFSVATWAGISRIVYGCQKTGEMVSKGYYEGSTDIKVINDTNNHKINLVYIADYETKMLELIKTWEDKQS